MGPIDRQVRCAPPLFSVNEIQQFANLAVTADVPERYAVVLDSQLVETASKIHKLRELLRIDSIHHSLYVSEAVS